VPHLNWTYENPPGQLHKGTTTFGALPLHIKQLIIRDLVEEYANAVPAFTLFDRCLAGICSKKQNFSKK